MSTRFEGKTAIVTGASRGIGYAIAQRLVDEGAKVVITARKQEALDAAVEALGGPDVTLAVAGRGDDTEHQDAVVAKTLEKFGTIDYFVNNTGINPVYGPLMEIDMDAARKILEVNVLSALSWVQKVNRAWQREHGGAIVNVASIAGLRPAPGIAMYGVSKAAVIHLTEELAVELGPNIRVNAVRPGLIETEIHASGGDPERAQRLSVGVPMGRPGSAEEVAEAILWLASEQASYVTGTNLEVTGGR